MTWKLNSFSRVKGHSGLEKKCDGRRVTWKKRRVVDSMKVDIGHKQHPGHDRIIRLSHVLMHREYNDFWRHLSSAQGTQWFLGTPIFNTSSGSLRIYVNSLAPKVLHFSNIPEVFNDVSLIQSLAFWYGSKNSHPFFFFFFFALLNKRLLLCSILLYYG